MACSHPRIMAVCDISKINNWPFVKRLEKNNWKINYETSRAYRLVAKDSREHDLENIPSWSLLDDMEIPCGNCIQCRIDYSKTWAIRCYLESLQYKNNFFITLTYDEDKIHIGELGNPTCCMKDGQDFIKRLRTKFKREFGHVGIRYFGCQEYGDLSMRPHMHFILFNCPIPDLTLDFLDEDGTITHRSSKYGPMYWSKIISDLWGHGFITVEDANYHTEAYVSRYIMKKIRGKEGQEVYVKQLGIEPPKLFMSLKPAIGGQFLVDNEDYLLSDPSLIIPRMEKEPLIAGVPRFYKKKLLDKYPQLYLPMLEKAKDNILKARSLLKGKQKINDNRANQEDHTIRSFEAFGRNAI